MALLTWRDVSAPNFNGVLQGYASANQMIGGGITGLSDALGKFGDQGALANLAKYTDPNSLSGDLQSGAFDTSNASAEALKTIMGRPAALIGNEGAMQTNQHNAVMNPIRQDSAALSLDNERVMMPLEQQAAALKGTKDQLAFDRSEKERANNIVMDQAWNNLVQNQGLTPEALNKFYSSFAENPEMQQIAANRIRSVMPNFNQGTLLPSEALGYSGGTAGTGVMAMPAEFTSLVSGAESTAGMPTGLLGSIAQQETGGRLNEFLTDPGKYHYEVGADGKRRGKDGRISTAFGPFGITESTARDPGYGVTPLRDRSLAEQARFASEYAMARAKQAGSLEAGLDGYGTGAGYGKDVLSRTGGNPAQQAKDIATATTQNTEAVTNANQVTNLLGSTPAANRALEAYKADPKGTLSAPAVAGNLTNGVLKGVDINDVTEAINQVATELGVSPSIAGTFVEDSVGSGFLSGIGGLGIFDNRKIDFDALESRLEAVAGKKGKNGLREKRNAFNTLNDALAKQAAFENTQTNLQSTNDNVVKLTAQIADVQTSMPNSNPAKTQILQSLQSQLQEAQARNARSMGAAGNQITNLLGAPPQPGAPAPIAQGIPEAAKQQAVQPAGQPAPGANFYSPEQAAQRAQQASRREAEALTDAATKAAEKLREEAVIAERRRKQVQAFGNFQEAAQRLQPTR